MKEVEAIRAREMVPRETNDILEDLRALRGYCMSAAERADREGRGLLTMAERDANPHGTDPCLKLQRLARAVRQIAVLQMEIMGQRPVAGLRAAEVRNSETPYRPAQATDADAARAGDRQATEDREPDDINDLTDRERADLNDLDDYDDRSYDTVIAGIRKTVGLPAGPGIFDRPADPARQSADVKSGRAGKHRARLTASASPVGAGYRERGPP